MFALREDGSRFLVYSDFANIDSALYVEEFLEIELDIFDLPVYGDIQTSTSHVAAFQNQSDEQTFCYACASPLTITSAARQKGYITCGYCQTITLLYTQTSHKPILGQSDPKKMAYKVMYNKQFAGVLWKKEQKEVLLLRKNKILQSLLNPSLRGKMVSQLGVKELTVPRKPKSISHLFQNLYSQYEQELSYSQDSDLTDTPVDINNYVFNTVQYTIMGQIGNEAYPLIPNVEDLREAAFIVTTLNNYLGTLEK